VHRLTRGRLWIGLLGGLLAGIVALNVISLGLNASSGRVAQQVEELERANSALRAQLAEQLSAGRVQSSAAAMGLVVPDPSTITYLTSGDRDAERAAKLLAGEPVEGGPAPAAPDPAPPAPTATSAPQPPPYSPAPVEQPAPAPAPEAPAAPPPASGEAGSAGGVGAGL
jgi:hypothetical protein